MSIEEAKRHICEEITNPMTDLHNPLSNKYVRWKIVDYLWVCYHEMTERGDCLDWLKNQYTQMTEEEKGRFIHELELMYLVLERRPK